MISSTLTSSPAEFAMKGIAAWLLKCLIDGIFTDLIKWLDKNNGTFRIIQKHKNSSGFKMEVDGRLILVSLAALILGKLTYILRV
jgi:hypothetical protein